MRGEHKKSIHEKLQQYIKTIEFFDDNIEEYIYIYDMTSERVFLTDKIREKYPIPPAGDDGNDFSDWNEIVYPIDRSLMDHYRRLLIERVINSFDIAYRILDRAGNKVWVRVKGALREMEGADSLLIVGRISEITASGMIDSLTGLRGTEKLMEDVNEHLKNTDGYLMILDLDNFKSLNLSRGRAYCDDVLKKVAEILDERVQYPMELYRLEGDCFAVSFLRKTREDVVAFYNSIKKALEKVCTISAGVVSYDYHDNTDSGALYLYAESALDQAKIGGKNRMIFFSADDYQKNLKKLDLLAELRTSVHNNCKGFTLEYQPQISGRDYNIYGVEALLRFDSPSRGRIRPDEFIPLLEQTGLICPVGKWVLETAISQCKQWRAYIPNLHMSVNMSYVQLQRDCVTDMVLQALKKTDLPGEALTLELTENVQLENYHHFNKIFYIWKQNGIRISIDDFGTGYSSLSYLKRIEIDEVKIDKCFVEHIQYNAYNYHLLKNMVELAHSAKIEVCCEGVETLEELMALQELEADTLQGFYFAKPCTVESFEQIYICKGAQAYQDRAAKEEYIRRQKSNDTQKILEILRNEEIGNITESMDEIVYVSDPDTYELYYLNEAGRRLTGVYDYKGCKCYQILQGRDKPCEFCTNAQLEKDKFLIWERENKYLNRHFMLKDKLIPWNGKMARVEIAFDITEKEILSQSIQERLILQRAILDSYRMLISTSNVKKTMGEVLKIMAEICNSERAFVLRAHGNSELWDLASEASAENTDVNRFDFPIPLDQLYDESAVQRIIHPIVKGGKTIGYIGIENPDNAELGSELVKTIAVFLGYILTLKDSCKK